MSTVSTTTRPAPGAGSGALLGLRITAVVMAALAVLQAVLAGRAFSGGALFAGHGLSGYVTLAVSVIAAVMAFLATRNADSKGIFMHAAGMAVIALAQVILGVTGVRLVHIVLGVLFLVGAIALATLSFRKAR